MTNFELLGSFYLGRDYDLDLHRGDPDSLVLYDSKHLVTHAVCVGMTGSGKTGLCMALIEEAAIDGIPAIVIDPKGDLANLLLTFPALAPADFEPWIDPQAAAARGKSPAELAEHEARAWREGLAQWGQDGARIQKLRDAAEFEVYTPGSNAGTPVSILDSLRAPGEDLREDGEAFRERISSTATSLLGLVGVDADPVQSREHILLSTLFAHAWSAGLDVDLGKLIGWIQAPPVTRIGVLELESFYPAAQRFELSMRLNNLLAAPGFATWLEGQALDVDALLYTPQGKPRIAIFSIAHLSDAERMFFVSLLLNQMLAWTRRQPGTSSLRAILYMDEIAGYCPPTAEPPSKRPLLSLMKQARAFGVGVVLATQNPVDLDYKGLANAGTWFLGRLQTERDKARVLDGLEGAFASSGGSFDRPRMEALLSRLDKRVFVLHDVHAPAPRIFEVRWVLSYLRGPMTRAELKRLGAMAPARTPAASIPAKAPARTAAESASSTSSSRPVLPSDIPQVFLPVRTEPPAGSRLVYRPMLWGSGMLRFADAKLGVEQEQPVTCLVPLRAGLVPADFDALETVPLALEAMESEPRPGLAFDALPPEASRPASHAQWRKGLVEALARSSKLALRFSPALGEIERPGEGERAFRTRLDLLARERRDALATKLRAKHGARFTTLDERIRRAEQAIEVQRSQARHAKLSTALSFGTALLGAFFGGRGSSASKASTAMRGASRSARESGDVERAGETHAALVQQRAELEAQIAAELAAESLRTDARTEVLEVRPIGVRKQDVRLEATALAWAPEFVDAHGGRAPAWK